MKGNSWSILKLLNTTVPFFASRGIGKPRLDAELLLGHCLGKGRVDLYLQYDQPVTEEELERFRGLVKRRVKREPVAYITGIKEFWSLPFKVSSEVLIPRPETELLIEIALKRIPILHHEPKGNLFLDLGTGCGALAICVAKELKRRRAKILATDISLGALRIAIENASRLGYGGEISFILADLFPPMRKTQIDLVICNPPYIPTSQIQALEAEIKDFEPKGAVDGGPDGLALIRRIIAISPTYLKPGGVLILEVDPSQADGVAEMMRRDEGFDSVIIYKDLEGRKRAVEAQRS